MGADTVEIMEFAELFSKGIAPVTGGALDQCKWFLDACRFTWSEEEHWRRKLGII